MTQSAAVNIICCLF